MRKRSKNLSLDPEVVRRGERYSRAHGTSLSSLVSRFLESLPLEDDDVAGEELTPAVRRLSSLVSRPGDPIVDFHEHLVEKHTQ